MLDELIFKGRNLDEALSKAANFFGVDRSLLKYICLDDSPEGEVRIQLAENPMQSAPRNQTPAARPAAPAGDHRSYNHFNDSGMMDRRMQPRNRRVERPRAPQRDRGRRDFNRPGPRRGGWQQEETDTSWLGQIERDALNFVKNLLRLMRMRLNVYPVQDQSRLVFNIDGPDRNAFLTKKGAVITAVQYLVNKIFMNRRESVQKIFIDSQGYRVAREEELKEIARRSAEKVKSTGKEYSLTPMNPYERRLIHMALKDDEEVTTVSQGEGFIKTVSIMLISEAQKLGLVQKQDTSHSEENEAEEEQS
jgi:predicted RNA-binding protein Jag